jgi:hypothetical protein
VSFDSASVNMSSSLVRSTDSMGPFLSTGSFGVCRGVCRGVCGVGKEVVYLDEILGVGALVGLEVETMSS